MGVDVNVRKPKGLNLKKFYKECSEIPIDVEILRNSWIHFHYAYSGEGHCVDCENFIKKFAEEYKVKIGQWNY